MIDLPLIVWANIAIHLNYQDVVVLGMVSKRLKDITDDTSIIGAAFSLGEYFNLLLGPNSSPQLGCE